MNDLDTLQTECREEAARLEATERPSAWAIARAWQVLDEHRPSRSWAEHDHRGPLVMAIAKAIDEGQIGVLTNIANWPRPDRNSSTS